MIKVLILTCLYYAFWWPINFDGFPAQFDSVLPEVEAGYQKTPFVALAEDPMATWHWLDTDLRVLALEYGAFIKKEAVEVFKEHALDDRTNIIPRNCITTIKGESANGIFGWKPSFVCRIHSHSFFRGTSIHSPQDFVAHIAVKYQPRPLLFAHNLVGPSHLTKGRENYEDGDSTKGQANNSRGTHDLREKGHLLLSIKVLVGAIMVAGGLYLLMNTVPHGYRLKTKTFLINTVLGILYVVLGALFASYSLFSLIGG
ncbi:hypothetical protein [Pseudosulfitobacter sp. SM2401]|uniref:hypothetical protein n=1 Tax=Pseudosulfitobacter sp. SM2401 TaxID=3350098 RepID=UPI0036F2CF5A